MIFVRQQEFSLFLSIEGKLTFIVHLPAFDINFGNVITEIQGTAVAQWLRCCATNRKAAGSNPDGVIGTFH